MNLLSPKVAAESIGVSLASLYRLRAKDPTFPKPFKLTAGCVRFRADELDAWLESKRQSRAA